MSVYVGHSNAILTDSRALRTDSFGNVRVGGDLVSAPLGEVLFERSGVDRRDERKEREENFEREHHGDGKILIVDKGESKSESRETCQMDRSIRMRMVSLGYIVSGDTHHPTAADQGAPRSMRLMCPQPNS